MTPDGVAPDLDCHRVSRELTRSLAEGRGFGDRVLGRPWGTDRSGERMRRVRIALDHARDELLRAHASTVLAMGQLGRNHAHMSDALAEARSQHEALFHVRGAVDALAGATRRPHPSPGPEAPSEYRDALTDRHDRTWLGYDQPGTEGLTHRGRTEG